MKKWARRLFKISIVFFVIIAICVTVLFNMGGNNETLKSSVEDYLEMATHYNAEIKTFHKMTFFPNVSVAFDDLTLSHPEHETVKITADGVDIALGFWDLIFGNRELRRLKVKNLSFSKGAILHKAITIDDIAIDEDADDNSFLIIKGKIGQDDLSFKQMLERHGKEKNARYNFGEKGEFDLSIGSMVANGTLRSRTMGGFHIKDLNILLRGDKVLNGDLSLVREKGGEFDINGDINFAHHGSVLNADIDLGIDPITTIRGDINAEILDPADFMDDSKFKALLIVWDNVFEDATKTEAPLSNLKLDLELKAADIKLGDKKVGPLNTLIKLENAMLDIKPLSGSLLGGDVNGEISIHSKENGVHTDVDVNIKGADYGKLLKGKKDGADTITGEASIKIKLSGVSTSLDNILQGLKGKFIFIGGEGKMNTGLIQLWGGGLVNAIMPDLSPETDINVNCNIAKFDIENAVATSEALFLDTQRITVTGEGDYDIDKNDLDISLSPKAKEVAIIDVSSEVIVTGPIENPSVRPSVIGFAKKVGEAILGTINPVFLAYSLVDLGLNDNHPCKPYIKSSAPAPELEVKPDAVEQLKENKGVND